MSSQTLGQQYDKFSIDSKKFYDTYINHRKYIFAFAAFLIFIGFVAFFQVCSVEAGWCDGCGFAASSAEASGNDNGQLDPSCVAITEFIFICFLVIGVAIMAYYGALVYASKKLTEAGNYYGAAEINGNSDKGADIDLLTAQTKLFVQTFERDGGNVENIIDKDKICSGYCDADDADGNE